VPSYNASNGDPVIFYGVTAGILAGAVAGDHSSPISDTTILSSMASECQILEHVNTQAPYAVMVAVWSILVGTIPSGRKAFGNWLSILLGFFAMLFHVVLTSEFPINKTGRYDIFTELYIRCIRDKEFYMKLKEDTVKAFETGQPVTDPDAEQLIEDDTEHEAGAKVSEKVDEYPHKDIVEQEGQEQAVMGDEEEHAQAAVEGGVDNAVVVQELPDEPETEEHFSGEGKKTHPHLD